MTLTIIFEKYLNFIWNAFMFDMKVFSNPWMYYIALIPAIGYFSFFIAKWTVIFFPVFLPIGFVLNNAKEFFTKIKVWIRR